MSTDRDKSSRGVNVMCVSVSDLLRSAQEEEKKRLDRWTPLRGSAAHDPAARDPAFSSTGATATATTSSKTATGAALPAPPAPRVSSGDPTSVHTPDKRAAYFTSNSHRHFKPVDKLTKRPPSTTAAPEEQQYFRKSEVAGKIPHVSPTDGAVLLETLRRPEGMLTAAADRTVEGRSVNSWEAPPPEFEVVPPRDPRRSSKRHSLVDMDLYKTQRHRRGSCSGSSHHSSDAGKPEEEGDRSNSLCDRSSTAPLLPTAVGEEVEQEEDGGGVHDHEDHVEMEDSGRRRSTLAPPAAKNTAGALPPHPAAIGLSALPTPVVIAPPIAAARSSFPTTMTATTTDYEPSESATTGTRDSHSFSSMVHEERRRPTLNPNEMAKREEDEAQLAGLADDVMHRVLQNLEVRQRRTLAGAGVLEGKGGDDDLEVGGGVERSTFAETRDDAAPEADKQLAKQILRDRAMNNTSRLHSGGGSGSGSAGGRGPERGWGAVDLEPLPIGVTEDAAGAPTATATSRKKKDFQRSAFAQSLRAQTRAAQTQQQQQQQQQQRSNGAHAATAPALRGGLVLRNQAAHGAPRRLVPTAFRRQVEMKDSLPPTRRPKKQ